MVLESSDARGEVELWLAFPWDVCDDSFDVVLESGDVCLEVEVCFEALSDLLDPVLVDCDSDAAASSLIAICRAIAI